MFSSSSFPTSSILCILTIFHLAVTSVSALTDTECTILWGQITNMGVACDTSSGTCPADCLTKLNEYSSGCSKNWAVYVAGYTKVSEGVCADVYMDWYADQRSDDCQDNMIAFSFTGAFCYPECTDRCQQFVDGICDHCDASSQGVSFKIDLAGCGSCPGTPTSPTAPSPSDSDTAPTPADSEDDSGSIGLNNSVFFLAPLLIATFSVALVW